MQVRAAGVNPADVKSYAGPATRRRCRCRSATRPPASWPRWARARPTTWARWRSGDEVIVFRTRGAYAADLVVPDSTLTRKPAGLGWPEAGGLMLAGATAYHTLEATGVREGDTVLVHGASGGVGLLAVQLARLRGARVIATAGERNHDLLRELGAEPVAYGDGLLERVRALAPEGVDVALDLVGSDEAMDVSLALVADRDRIASIANFARGAPRGHQAARRRSRRGRRATELRDGGPPRAGPPRRRRRPSAWSSPRRTPSTTPPTPTARSPPATPPARSSCSR